MSRAEPKTLVLLGVPFHDVTMDETLDEIDRMVRERIPRYLVTANLDFAAKASRDVELHRILLDAHRVLCDGTPLLWASRWMGTPLRERVAGSDLTPKLAERAAARGHRLFFLGSDDAVLREAKAKLEAQFQGLQICGFHSPPHATLLGLDHAEILSRIRAARPDILLVALGNPKQEKWIYMHHANTGVPCSIGIGASLDFIAGKFSRAPVWMRKAGIEWVYRLAQEPRRLWKRYFEDFLFLGKALWKQERLMREAPRIAETQSVVAGSAQLGFTCLQWAGRADLAAIASGAIAEPAPQSGRARVLLDLAGVTLIDGAGIGLILSGFKKCKQAGGALVLFRVPRAVGGLLAAMSLDRLLPSADSLDAVRACLHLDTVPLRAEFDAANAELILKCASEITAATVHQLSEQMRREISLHPGARMLRLDLADVDFIDSSGLQFLLDASELARSAGSTRVIVTGANNNVRNVIALAGLGDTLAVE
jgi:N-acetylglucosaminyldiphosphoundecaprenol N-acetyl-beta-D-mannosaminyltransferase